MGTAVRLVREYGNSHDSGAVRVVYAEDYDIDNDDDAEDIDEYVLGYIPAKSNRKIAALLDMG